MSKSKNKAEKRALKRTKKHIALAEDANTPKYKEKNLKKAATWAEKVAEKKNGEDAEKWRQLAEKAREKIPVEDKKDSRRRSKRRRKRSRSKRNRNRKDRGSEGPVEFQDPPNLNFDDVGGMNDLINKFKEKIILQLENTEYREALNVSPTNGILLYGPPGTGKTYISKALAGELEYNYAEVKSSDLFNRYLGETEKNVAALFQQIKENAPCLVFIDELEAIASNRQQLQGEANQAYKQAVSEILQGLQELQDSEAIIIGATNMLDSVDGAIRRSGRFDEKIEVGPPDANARKEILKIHLRERETEGKFDWQKIAEQTKGFTASDLKKTVKDASQQALVRSDQQNSLQPVNEEMVLEAVKDTEPSLGHWKQ